MTKIERLLGATRAMDLTIELIGLMIDQSPTAGEGYVPAGRCTRFLETLTIYKNQVMLWYNDPTGNTGVVSVAL